MKSWCLWLSKSSAISADFNDPIDKMLYIKTLETQLSNEVGGVAQALLFRFGARTRTRFRKTLCKHL